MKTKDIAKTGLLLSLSLVLSFVESCIPAFVAVPGIKAGLANIVVVFALYRINFKTAFTISVFRVLIAAVVFGSVISLAYSLSGAVVSLCIMALLKKTSFFSVVGVSVAGGVMHNVAQIATACIILGTDKILYYIPFLLIGGTVAGILIGTAGAVVIKRVEGEV